MHLRMWEERRLREVKRLSQSHTVEARKRTGKHSKGDGRGVSENPFLGLITGHITHSELGVLAHPATYVHVLQARPRPTQATCLLVHGFEVCHLLWSRTWVGSFLVLRPGVRGLRTHPH